ncbi:MAG: cytoplasmic protein [Gammaproteobacteria bacterium]|nr:cytoplasmic protein [Gammaproteobacteria bacterium]MAY02811.1 cytoplasmic protein [Gammaproteobacteria bacterium]|tara:strand:- start:139 stop:627 length:489 start_codon:yes stop_codon:yes gene_type:complete
MNVKRSYSIDLSAQMAVCDANYIRILQLLPKLNLGVRREISFAGRLPSGYVDDSATVIEVIEKFKYTSTVRIAQENEYSWSLYKTPEMLIRMYHDAKTAEVISYQQVRYLKAKYELPNKNMYQADEKEQINFLLSEWLCFCRQEGLCSSTALAEKLSAKSAA